MEQATARARPLQAGGLGGKAFEVASFTLAFFPCLAAQRGSSGVYGSLFLPLC